MVFMDAKNAERVAEAMKNTEHSPSSSPKTGTIQTERMKAERLAALGVVPVFDRDEQGPTGLV